MAKTALITGASTGIGLELARLFAADRTDLVLVARSRPRLEALAQELTAAHSIRAVVLPADLSQPGAPDEIFAEVRRQGMPVDYLVNNAGTQVYGEFASSDLAANLAMIQVNLTALTHLTRLFLPEMVERKFGKVMNLGSTGSYAPGVLNAVYCGSKAYILSFSEAIAAELHGSGVTVTAVCPGATESEFASRAGITDIRLFRSTMTARRVAEIGYRAFMKGRPVMVTGFGNQLQVLFYIFSKAMMPLLSPGIVRRVGYFAMGKEG